MPIISFEFVFLLLGTGGAYYAVPQKYKRFVLLLASAAYLFAAPVQLLLLAASVLLDYGLAQGMVRATQPGPRKLFLFVGLLHNAALLWLGKLAEVWHFVPPGVLAIGVSFFAIAKMGLLLDLYWGRVKLALEWGAFSVFSMLFLTISSGPVERAKHLLTQLANPQTVDHTGIILGLRRILLGVFKKVVLADGLAALVKVVYDQPEQFSGLFLALATVLFAFQLYADFSGYTDIVVGAGKLLGLDLFENFRQPYGAVSILDFWKRWHISLTDWIRDFLFFPLTRYLLGKKLPVPNVALQALVYLTVMSVVGLWHGLTPTFLIWGALHGLYMSLEALTPARLKVALEKPAWHLARVALTFSMVCFAWIWFRATSFDNGWYITTHLWHAGDWGRDVQALTLPALAWGAVSVLLLLLLDVLEQARKLEHRLDHAPVLARWALYYALCVPIFLKLFSNTVVSDFVYFRF